MASASTSYTLTPDATGWPTPLRELRDRPDRLFCEGTLPAWERAVGVVGTRNAEPAALRFTRGLAASLAGDGCVIVSGGALGVDAAAHRGALEASGSSVAILASGLEPPYPRRHAALFDELRRAGALLSEEPPGTPVQRYLFLRRNRLIAALSRVVVVVQAPEKSGALSTARCAAELGRPVLVAPGAPWDLRSSGGLELLRKGARLCLDADDVRDALRAPVQPPASSRRGSRTGCSRRLPAPMPPKDLEGDAADVWRVLGASPRSTDSLCAALAWPPPRVSRALLELLLLGRADELHGSYVRT